MGKHFGELFKLTGITYYRLSPHELRAFAGALNPGFKNTLRRIRENFFVMGVPFAINYAVYDWANKEHYRTNRKNPDEFKDDV